MKIFFLLGLIFTHSLSFSTEYLSCNLSGQLGNQLFTIATTLALAWDNDAAAVFDQLKKSADNRSNNLRHVFFRLQTKIPEGVTLRPYFLKHFDYHKIPYRPNTRLHIWSPSLKYFDHHREKIQQLFAPSKKMQKKLEGKFSEILSHPNSVAVHIRTYHPKNQLNGLCFLGEQYFLKAMDYFPDDALFVIFSCRPGWVKKVFNHAKPNMLFMEEDYIEEFFLMSQCKHQITSNSTFSWWAAYLNKNPKKIVIAPSLWDGVDHKRHQRGWPGSCRETFYPNSWIMLTPNIPTNPRLDMLENETTSVVGE